jgi:hypothetical protein
MESQPHNGNGNSPYVLMANYFCIKHLEVLSIHEFNLKLWRRTVRDTITPASHVVRRIVESEKLPLDDGALFLQHVITYVTFIRSNTDLQTSH